MVEVELHFCRWAHPYWVKVARMFTLYVTRHPMCTRQIRAIRAVIIL